MRIADFLVASLGLFLRVINIIGNVELHEE